MSALPIESIRTEIIEILRRHACVIVQAPTGSGKSTRIPQMLIDNGLADSGTITILQPRRLAARMLARRVATERGGCLGDEVGYQVRFDNRTSPRTRIRFETDGITLRRLHGNPTLHGTAVLVFDEFHERHLYGDLLLGLATRLLKGPRPDLKLVVMSATLDTDELEAFLPDARVIQTAGRTFPVEIRHLAPGAKLERSPPWEQAARVLPSLLAETQEGDVLIFMPGAHEINRTLSVLRPIAAAANRLLLPLHGNLSPEAQDQAVIPSVQRRIIVTTNIAETSLTIEGITLVIDSGLVRRAGYDARRGIGTLLVEKTSRASSDQRAGRAGRTAPGICMRLWTERDHATRPIADLPELLRMDLAECVLQIKRAGVFDIHDFPWITPPPERGIAAALALLKDLGALDATGIITPTGKRMATFPLHPRIARMLLAAEPGGCVPSLCLVAALLQERGILLPAPAKAVCNRRLELAGDTDESDILLRLRAWAHVARHHFRRTVADEIGVRAETAHAVGELQRRLLETAEDQGLNCFEKNPAPDAICKAVLTAFPDHVARRTGGDRCSLTGGRRGTVSPGSVVGRGHTLVVAADVQEIGRGQGETEVMLSLLTAIREEWLTECFGDAFRDVRRVTYDTVGTRMRAERQTLFRDLVIRTKRTTDVTDDEAAGVLAAEVLAGRITIKEWDIRVEEWIARVNLVAACRAETGVPPIGNAERQALLEQICHGARNARDVRNASVRTVLRQWLDAAQTATVEAYAPVQVRIENGLTPRVHYDDPAGPYIAMRVQELYGTNRLPTVGRGCIPLKVRILAPNQRPVQVTDDLAAFWSGSYAQVRKDLRGRYPKHEWR